jgi:type IV secretory pathway VirB2 component (pilin)
MCHKRNKYVIADTSAISQCLMLSIMAIAIYSMMIPAAHAVGGIMCGTIGSVMTGGVGRAIATIGVLMVGVGATLGRMQWTTAITVAIGIAGMFSAASLVLSFSGGLQSGCFGT